MNEYFYSLTPDIVIKALEVCGFEPTGHCMTLNSFENRVYDLKMDDDSHVVAKFYRPGRWSKEQIIEEHQFLLDLQADEIPVCAPLIFSDGTTLRKTEDIYYAVWPRTGGRAGDELTDTELQILGHLLARIHNNGAAKKAEQRIELTGKSYGTESLEFLIQNNFIPVHLKTRYENAVKEIVDIYDTLRADVPFHRIHGDPILLKFVLPKVYVRRSFLRFPTYA